jgi:Rod binding domain-containing protein
MSTIVAAQTQALTPQQQAAMKNLHQVCTQFEGVFVGMLLQEMRKSESEQTLFGPKSSGEKIFGEMLDDQRAQSIAGSGSFGIAKMLESQLRGAVLANAAQEAHSSTKASLP